jgi:hypothetical protein
MREELCHIIPTHERPDVCQRLINSIHKYYPDHSIYVCDDSRQPHKYEHAKNVIAPAYDIGLSAKRNLLVQKSEEPYIFLWDDDYLVTEDTNLEVFWKLLHKLDDVGIVGGEWIRSNGRRDVWFTGDMWVEGPIEYHRPPEDINIVDTSIGEIRYHDVMFCPNWFIADRRTVESIYWDEELKLQEHSEFFARLAATRSLVGKGSEKDDIWLERYRNRQGGDDSLKVDSNGRVEVYTLSTFRNRDKLSHVDGMVSSNEWVRVDLDYAKDLEKKGLAYTRKSMDTARPFPIKTVGQDVPLGVAITPDTTCYHIRWGENSKTESYNKNRFRNDFWPIQHQKLGTTDIDLVQWNSYPYKEIEYLKPKDVDFSTPNNYTSYAKS